MDDIELMHYAVAKSLSEVREHKARIKLLLSFVEGAAEGDCWYDDNCPIFGSRHYRCIPCKARTTLEEYNAATRNCNPG